MRTFTAVLCLAAAILAQTAAAAPVEERAILSMSSICPTWEAQCAAACSAISTTTAAKSTCTLSSRVTKRAGMSCKCGTKDLTSSVLKTYLSVSSSDSTSLGNNALSGSLVAATATATGATPSIVAGAEATMLISPSDLMPVGSVATTQVVALAGGAKLASDAAESTTSSSSSAQATSTSSSLKKTKTKTSTKTSTKTKTKTATATSTSALTKVNAYIESAIPIVDAW